MSGPVSKDVLISALLKGVYKAQGRYFKATGGQWLWEAPEYLICAEIFDSLLKKGVYVTLEQSVKGCLSESGSVRRGAPSKVLRRNGRNDLVVWWSGSTEQSRPRVAVEVKNQVTTFGAIEGDIGRLAKMVDGYSKKSGQDHRGSKGSFQFGAVVFYTSTHGKNPKDSLERRLKKLLSGAQNHLKKVKGLDADSFKIVMHQGRQKIRVEGEMDAWTACCFVIKKK